MRWRSLTVPPSMPITAIALPLMESIENELIDAFEKSLRYVNSFDVTALIEAIYDMVDQNQAACRVPDSGEYKLNGPHADDCPGQGGQHCLLAERAA